MGTWIWLACDRAGPASCRSLAQLTGGLGGPDRCVTSTGGRIIWTQENTIAYHQFMFIAKPDVPADELTGKCLIPFAPFGGPDAARFAVADDEPQENANG